MYKKPLLRMRSGALVNALAPDPRSIQIEDIAYGLSRRMRYSCQSDLSVAQHCCLGAQVFLDRGHERSAYAFLMHDAAEYLTGDVATPLKHGAGMDAFRLAEKQIEEIISAKFRFDYPLTTAVKQMDSAMLATESRDLGLEILFDGPAPRPLNMRLDIWAPEDARVRFLCMFNILAPREFHVPHSATLPTERRSA